MVWVGQCKYDSALYFMGNTKPTSGFVRAFGKQITLHMRNEVLVISTVLKFT